LIALQSTVASLDQAQGPAQLKARLGEVRKHYENWKSAVGGGASSGGASGSFDEPKANAGAPKAGGATPPKPMKGMVRNGYKFKGGDPADQSNWEVVR
jgi:hypothetical protein